MRREVALTSLEHAPQHALERSEGPLPSLEVNSTEEWSLGLRSRVVVTCSDLNRASPTRTSKEVPGVLDKLKVKAFWQSKVWNVPSTIVKKRSI